MKKALSLFLALALCLSLCACGSNSDSAITDEQNSQNETASTSTNGSATDYVQLGQEIDVDSATITFSTAKLTYTIGDTISVTAQDGMRFFGLMGSLKNTGGTELPVDAICAEMIFNNEFTYTAKAIIGGNRNSIFNTVAPLANAEYWVYAEVPDALLDQLSTCEVRISLNKDFASLPAAVDDGDYIIRLRLDEEVCQSTLDAMDTATEFFAECPILPKPTNYSPVWETSSSSSSFNGKVSSVKYGYSVSFGRNDDIKDVYNTYVSKLQNIGFTIQGGSNNSCDIYSDGTKLASVSVGNDQIAFEILPGNENLTAAPSGNTAGETEISGGDTIVRIGDIIETDYISMTIEKYDSDTEIHSGASQYGVYSYYTSQNGEPYFYIYGTLKNLGANPVDIRNIYVQFCFDGKYNYKGSVAGVNSGYSSFIDDVSPLTSVNYYMYADVPQELIDSFSTCVVRVGFTENFDYKVIDVNDLPQFDRCDDIFSIEIDAS